MPDGGRSVPAAREGCGPQGDGLCGGPASKRGLNFPFIHTHKQHSKMKLQHVVLFLQGVLTVLLALGGAELCRPGMIFSFKRDSAKLTVVLSVVT